MTSTSFSDYIVFADESGDHSLTSINPIYPIFVLCFCLIRKDYYLETIVPEVHKIKMRYFGHDQIIFHERDFVKRTGIIGQLNENERQSLMEDINKLMLASDLKIIAAVIDKQKLKARYTNPYNPYHIALQFCLERTCDFLSTMKQTEKTFVIAESRGKIEDNSLKEEFKKIIGGQRNWGCKKAQYESTPLELYCSPKGSNSSGVQIADLTARPIGLAKLNPGQSNRAYDIIQGKLWEVKDFP